MKAVGIIPARYASTRFPGKPLTPIAGRPMIERVWERARRAKRLRDVIVATDDERIADACRRFGARVAMTSSEHPTGTDRLAEAAGQLDDDIVVNIQGDEPLIEGFVIDAAVDALVDDETAAMSTIVHEAEREALDDPNRVKAVIDRGGRALYFSRSAIPHLRSAGARIRVFQHVGLYAYRRDFLQTFLGLARTPAEEAEELEQLRVLEHGYAIRVGVVEGWHSVPVDVPDDVARVEAILLREADVKA